MGCYQARVAGGKAGACACDAAALPSCCKCKCRCRLVHGAGTAAAAHSFAIAPCPAPASRPAVFGGSLSESHAAKICRLMDRAVEVCRSCWPAHAVQISLLCLGIAMRACPRNPRANVDPSMPILRRRVPRLWG